MFNFRKKFLEPEKLPSLIAYFYNFLPARILQPTYQYIAETLPLKNEGILADIGSGPGNLDILIAQKYPNLKVIGVDLSETMIKIANFKKKDLPNLEFKMMDGKNLEFEDKSMDYVISTLSFHHWKKPQRVLNEIYRVLKPEGFCWIYDGYSGASDEDINKSLKYPLRIKIQKWFIRQILAWHGFSEKEYENYVKPLIEESDFKEAIFLPERIYMRIELKKI